MIIINRAEIGNKFLGRSIILLRNRIFLYATEFFAGMSVMAVELGASRLLAPYFSSSQIVWTIIIGTIMIAMALGNIYGGRSADRNPNPDRLYRRIMIAAAWIALNALIFILYFTNVIDKGIMLIIALAYSVCDMVCILFFCPFETWFLKNKCCTTCRIYNWDYLMMFTPLIVIPHPAAQILALLALVLLLRWEITYWLHPEWFYEETNASLKCAHCTEKLCSHKKQLRILHHHIMNKTLEVVKETTNKLRQ